MSDWHEVKNKKDNSKEHGRDIGVEESGGIKMNITHLTVLCNVM